MNILGPYFSEKQKKSLASLYYCLAGLIQPNAATDIKNTRLSWVVPVFLFFSCGLFETGYGPTLDGCQYLTWHRLKELSSNPYQVTLKCRSILLQELYNLKLWYQRWGGGTMQYYIRTNILEKNDAWLLWGCTYTFSDAGSAVKQIVLLRNRVLAGRNGALLWTIWLLASSSRTWTGDLGLLLDIVQSIKLVKLKLHCGFYGKWNNLPKSNKQTNKNYSKNIKVFSNNKPWINVCTILIRTFYMKIINIKIAKQH